MRKDLQSQLTLLGGNIRRLRCEKPMTQERLAELADLNIRTIQKIEAGQSNILVTTANRIQKSLGCDWDELMRGI